jgi:uncharacterized protein YraI
VLTRKLALVLGAGLAIASLSPVAASAATNGWTVRGVSQRAGPGPEYPRIGYIPAGAHVRIFGCIRGVRSCDVSWHGNRGWVNGNALAGFYRGKRVPLVRFYFQIGVPYVGFDFAYWDRHYRDKPFFHQRDRWWSEKDWQKYGSGDDNWKGPKQWDSQDKNGSRPDWCRPGSDNPRCADDGVTGQNDEVKPSKKQGGQFAGGRHKGEDCRPDSDAEECAQMHMQ